MPTIGTPVALPKRPVLKRPIDPTKCATTRHEFCALQGLNMDQYRKLQREGNGPRERSLPGLLEPQILPADYAKWVKKMSQPKVQAQVKRERERRAEHMRQLAKDSIKSGKHISQRRRAAKQAAE